MQSRSFYRASTEEEDKLKGRGYNSIESQEIYNLTGTSRDWPVVDIKCVAMEYETYLNFMIIVTTGSWLLFLFLLTGDERVCAPS